MPPSSNDADASNAQVSPVQAKVNDAVGGASARVKVRPRVASLCPSSSVAIRMAAYVLPPEYEYVAYLGYADAVAGRARDARDVLKELDAHRQDQYVSWYGIAVIHDALGEKAPALAALQGAFDERAVEFGLNEHDYAPFRTIASEPAYQAVIRKVGR